MQLASPLYPLTAPTRPLPLQPYCEALQPPRQVGPAPFGLCVRAFQAVVGQPVSRSGLLGAAVGPAAATTTPTQLPRTKVLLHLSLSLLPVMAIPAWGQHCAMG